MMQAAPTGIDTALVTAGTPTPSLVPATNAPAAAQDYSDHLPMLVRYFEESEDMTRRARELAERDRDYHDNFDDDHWTTKEKAALRRRGQPVVTSNYIKRKVATLKGGEMRMRSDPKAFPRNPQDAPDAETATQALRYIGDQNKFNVTRSKVYEEFLVEGYGGADVVVQKAPNGQKRVKIIRVQWDRLFYDPHSSAEDFSDAKYKGVVIWRDAKRDDQDVLGETLRSSDGETYGDRPHTAWVDSARKRVRVVQMHYLHDGEWMVATFTKAGFTPDGAPVISPYLDRDGNSACSLVLRSAYIDRENNRFGAVRDWISTQEEINKRRSKAMHLINSRQTYGNKKAVPDATKAKQELQKPDGHLEINADAQYGQDFGLIPTADMAAGNVQMLQMSISEMNANGPNAAMAGKAAGQQSGRALEAQVQAGSVEMEPLVDELRQWTRDVYEAAWLRARQFWTDETWIRVTDDDRSVRFVGLNKKVTLGEQLERMSPEMAAAQAQRLQLRPNDPRLQQVVGTENNISGLDVDIEVEEGPDLSTLQSEEIDILDKFVERGLPIPPRAIVEASNLRASKKAAILKQMPGGEAEDNPALQQAQQQIDQMGKEMQGMTEAINQLKGDLTIKNKEADTKQFAAETDRLEVVAPAMGPAEIQALVMQSLREIFMPPQPLGPQEQQQPPQQPMQPQQVQPAPPQPQEMGPPPLQ